MEVIHEIGRRTTIITQRNRKPSACHSRCLPNKKETTSSFTVCPLAYLLALWIDNHFLGVCLYPPYAEIHQVLLFDSKAMVSDAICIYPMHYQHWTDYKLSLYVCHSVSECHTNEFNALQVITDKTIYVTACSGILISWRVACSIL